MHDNKLEEYLAFVRKQDQDDDISNVARIDICSHTIWRRGKQDHKLKVYLIADSV